MEVMDGAPGKAGQATCKAILSQFDMEYRIPTDMDRAMQQLERYRLSHGVGIHACLIASVCQSMSRQHISAFAVLHDFGTRYPVYRVSAMLEGQWQKGNSTSCPYHGAGGQHA